MSKKRAPVFDRNLLLERYNKLLRQEIMFKGKTLEDLVLSKYRNIRTANGDGSFSDSRKEARTDAEYQTLLRCGQLKSVERKKRYPLKIKDVLICTYVSDWVVTDRAGAVAVIDAKGFKTPVYRIKKKLMKALYGIDIIER